MSCLYCKGKLTREESMVRGFTFEQWRDEKRNHEKTCKLSRSKNKQAQPERPKFPAVTHEQRTAGERRVTASMEHINEARDALDAACRDLCAVIGANQFFYEIRKLSNACREIRERIDASLITSEPFALDHEPKANEHPHSGCGRTA